MALKRNISKANLLLLAISSIIGSGWLFGSYYTAQIAGPAAILSWFLGGIFISIIALTLAELSTMLPLAGGSTTYASLSHGKLCGALFAWVTWLWSMGVAPIEVQAVMQYSSHYIAGIVNPKTANLTAFGFLIATFLMFVLCAINLVGVKFLFKTNKIISIWKIAIPALIAFILLLDKPHFSNIVSQPFMPYGFEGVFSSISTGGVALSFFGFQTGIFLAGEAKNPQKSIPYALFGSLFVCTVLYSLLQWGFIVGVDPQALQMGWQKISFAGDTGPFAALLLGLGMFTIAKLLYIDAAVSPLGTALGYVAASSRILYSIGLQGKSPSFISKLNSRSIPWVSLLINFGVGMIFFLPFPGWKEMASFLSAAIVISLVCAPIALPIFRDNMPEHERAFKLPLGKLISFVALYLCTLIFYWTGLETILKFDECFVIIAVLVCAMPLITPKLKQQPLQVKSSLWLFAYLILCTGLSYYGTFGGTGQIGLKSSFAVIFIICLSVDFIAKKTAIPMLEMKSNYQKLIAGHRGGAVK